MRKRRLLNWLSGVVVLYVAYRVVRAMFWSGAKGGASAGRGAGSRSTAAIMADPAMNAAFAGRAAASAPVAPPLLSGAGSDPFEAAFAGRNSKARSLT